DFRPRLRPVNCFLLLSFSPLSCEAGEGGRGGGGRRHMRQSQPSAQHALDSPSGGLSTPARLASSPSTCSSVCAAERVRRRRGVPAGTVGGRTAPTSQPPARGAPP